MSKVQVAAKYPQVGNGGKHEEEQEEEEEAGLGEEGVKLGEDSEL